MGLFYDPDDEEARKKVTSGATSKSMFHDPDLDRPAQQPQPEQQVEQKVEETKPVVQEKKQSFFQKVGSKIKDIFTPDKPKEEKAKTKVEQVINYTPRTKDSVKKSAELESASIDARLSELESQRSMVIQFINRDVKSIEKRTPEERKLEEKKWAEMERLKLEYIGNEKVAKATSMENFLTKYLDEDYRTLQKSKQQLQMVVKNTQTGRSNKIEDLAKEVGITLERENLPLGIGGLFGITEELKKSSVKNKISKGEKLTKSEQAIETQIRAESEFNQRDVGVLQVASGALVSTLSIMADIGVGKALTGATKTATISQKVISSLKTATKVTATTQLTRVVEQFSSKLGDQYTTVATEDGGFELIKVKEGDVPLTAAISSIANVWGNNVIETLGGDLVDSGLKTIFSPLTKVLGKSAKLQSLGNTKVAKVIKEMYISKTLRDLIARNSPLGELSEEFMSNQFDKFTSGQPLGLTKDEAEKIAGSTLLMWGLLAPAGIVADATKTQITEKDLAKLAPVVREEIENTVDLSEPISQEDLKPVIESIASQIEEGKLKAKDLIPGATTTEIKKGEVVLYNSTDKKITETTKEYKKVLEVANSQIDVLRDLVEKGDAIAKELLYGTGTKERTKIDYAKADYYIQQKLGGQYEAIKYNNEDRPALGAEYHDLKENKFYATSEAAAKLYQAQTRGEKYNTEEFKSFVAKVGESLNKTERPTTLEKVGIEKFIEEKQLDSSSIKVVDNRNFIVENSANKKALLIDIKLSRFGKPRFETLAQDKYEKGKRKITDPIEAVLMEDGSLKITDGANRFSQAVANKDATIPVVVIKEDGTIPSSIEIKKEVIKKEGVVLQKKKEVSMETIKAKMKKRLTPEEAAEAQRKVDEELKPLIEDEADLSTELVPKRKRSSAEYSAAMYTPEQQQKINEAIYNSPNENLEHSYLSNQISKKKDFEPAGSVEEFKRRIDQMHKFGQLYSVPRRGGLRSPEAAGVYTSVPMDSKKRKEKLKKIKLPEVGEVKIKDDFLLPNKLGLEVLAHELGHALHYQITGGTGKSIRPIFDGGNLTDTEWQVILKELEAVEVATQGQAAVNAKPEYYGKETEKLAYFLGAYVANRPLVTKIAPNAISAFVDQSMTHQVIADYLAAINEMIDKGAVVSKFIPDRRQRYQALLGKTVGDKAFMVEQIYKSSVDRSIVGIAKLMKEKFKDIKDDPSLIYKAADGITHTTDGKPAFGTKDYVYPEDGKTFNEQEVIGYARLKYKIEVSKTDGSQRAWVWRYTPKQAEANYKKLSPAGKKLIKGFTADLTEAKDWFNRNVIAQTYSIDQSVEGWIHRIYKPEETKGVFGWKRLQRKTASMLQHRKLSTAEALQKGLVEDLQKSMLTALVDYETKKSFNQMVEQMFGTVVLPVAKGTPLKEGWVEVSGNIYSGIAKKFEKGRTVLVEDGKKIVVPTRNYQMPKDIYDRFKYYSDVATEASLVTKAMDLLYKWWRINILTHPGTVATNFVGGGIQYMSKVVEDFYLDAMFMPGDVKKKEAPFAQTRLNMKALFIALSPKGWQNAPEWLYGGDSSTSFGMVRENKTAVDKANQSMDAAASKMLFTFNAVENYWKKVITYSVVGKGKVEQLASQSVFDQLTKDQEALMRDIYDNIDMYGYDYGNRAKLLEGYAEGSSGKVVTALKPFLTYLYKYEKHLESYVTGAFDSSIPPQQRIAKVMTLATMIGLMLAAQAWRDDEKETPEGDENTDPRLRARGRTYIGKDKEGNEIFARTSKYPFADIADAIKAISQGDSQTVVDIIQDKVGALSPLAKILLYSMGYTNDFEKYTPKEVLFSDTVASYVPAYRILNDLSQSLDPFKRKKTKWYQSFTSLIPLVGASEETLTALRGDKKVLKIPAEGTVSADVPGRTTKDVDVRNYWQDNLLSFFTGVYLTRINPEYAKAVELREAKKEEEAKEKAEYEGTLKEAATTYLANPSKTTMKELYNNLVREKYGDTSPKVESRGKTQIRKDLKEQILLESDIAHPEFITGSGSNATKADFLADYKEEMGDEEFKNYLQTLWKAEVISSELLDVLINNDTITSGLADSIKKQNRTGFF